MTADADADDCDPDAFWRLGPLPAPPTDDPVPTPDGVAPDRLARPDVQVDGRNLADVLRAAYDAITG